MEANVSMEAKWCFFFYFGAQKVIVQNWGYEREEEDRKDVRSEVWINEVTCNLYKIALVTKFFNRKIIWTVLLFESIYSNYSQLFWKYFGSVSISTFLLCKAENGYCFSRTLSANKRTNLASLRLMGGGGGNKEQGVVVALFHISTKRFAYLGSYNLGVPYSCIYYWRLSSTILFTSARLFISASFLLSQIQHVPPREGAQIAHQSPSFEEVHSVVTWMWRKRKKEEIVFHNLFFTTPGIHF